MIGPGALSQTRVRRVTVTLGAVGSAEIIRHCEHREEVYTYSVCVYPFQVGKREDEKEVTRGQNTSQFYTMLSMRCPWWLRW